MSENRRISAKSERRSRNVSVEARAVLAASESRTVSVSTETRTVAADRFNHGHGAGSHPTRTLVVPFYVDDDTFFQAVIARDSDATLAPAFYVDDDTFYSSIVDATNDLTPSLFDDGDTFYDHLVTLVGDDQDLTPSLFTDADTFYAVVSSGALDLQPSLFADDDTFYAPTATSPATLAPNLFVDADTFYSAEVNPFDLRPSLFVDADTFYTAVVGTSDVTLVPSLYADPDTFYSATVAGANTLTPSLFADADTFYAATVSNFNLAPSLFVDADTFYSPSVSSGALSTEDGGANYWAQFSHTAAAGWASPSFYPIGAWLAGVRNQGDADRWHDLNLNTMFGMTSDTPLSLLRANSLWVVVQANELDLILSNNGGSLGSESVGLLTQDEPSTYQEGMTGPIGSTPNVIQDGRFWWVNNTSNWVIYGALNGGPPSTRSGQLYTPIATPNGSTRHIDASSIDFYFFAAQGAALLSVAGNLQGLGVPSTLDQAHRGHTYGDLIGDQRSDATLGNSPIFSYIELGGPWLEDTSASYYITPPEVNWAAWSSIIHGAKGIIYFNHTFAGPAQTSDILATAFYQTIQPGQSISIYNQVKQTGALIASLAPVINAPTIHGYATVSPSGFVDGVVTSGLSGIEILVKLYGGQYYIFADTRASMTATNIVATFTLSGVSSATVTVINESRTIPVVNGSFTDTFATGSTVHIYRVG